MIDVGDASTYVQRSPKSMSAAKEIASKQDDIAKGLRAGDTLGEATCNVFLVLIGKGFCN